MKKIVSFILIITMIFGMFSTRNVVEAKERERKEDYVIITKDRQILEQFDKMN